MTLRYAHLSPKHLTSAVRVLDSISREQHSERLLTLDMDLSNA